MTANNAFESGPPSAAAQCERWRQTWRARYAAGGGCCSTRGSSASMQAQRGALDVQMVIAGLARFGSSKLPTRTKIKCGRASASLNKGVPHVEQNCRCIRLPLSAMLAKSVVLPTTLNAAVRKQAPTVPLPAPKYWQSRHQQVRVVIGGSSLSQRTAPQRHPPVNVIALSQGQEGSESRSYPSRSTSGRGAA